MEQVQDFYDESAALHVLLDGLPDAAFAQKTQFKDWSFNDILQHLHFWNRAAALSLSDEPAFTIMINDLLPVMLQEGIRAAEIKTLGELSGQGLLVAWYDGVDHVTNHFSRAEPNKRVKWVGPDMSARSSITARLMESWAHGQAIYDVLGKKRLDTDRIRNIAHLGVKTFRWTYNVNNLPVPGTLPFVQLTAPSGDIWHWNKQQEENCITGSATEFCQVVTQVRNIADTDLCVTGAIATQWMAMAQCFAGTANSPPLPGTRFIKK